IAEDLQQKIKIVDQGEGDNYHFEKAVGAGSEAAGPPPARDVDPGRALGNMVRLATAGKADALYSLPIDQLAGQLSVAAQSVLDFPRNNPDLLLVLSAGAETADLIRFLAPPPPVATAPLPADRPPSQEEDRKSTRLNSSH